LSGIARGIIQETKRCFCKGNNGKLNFEKLFPANQRPKNGMKLEYMEPATDDGTPTPVIDSTDAEKEVEFWVNSFGGVCGGLYTQNECHSCLYKVAKPKVYMHKSGWIISRFENDDDRDFILKGPLDLGR